MINSALRNLYHEHFHPVIETINLPGYCSPPFLLSIDQSWLDQKTKLLIVGQEPMFWIFSKEKAIEHNYAWNHPDVVNFSSFAECTDGVDIMMHAYSIFDWGPSSPFWNAYYKLEQNLSVKALWGNLFHFSINGKSIINNINESDRQKIYSAQKGLMKKEITILKPDAVVFFTGPIYDCALRTEIPDVVMKSVNNYTEREFSQLKSEHLPLKSFRLYHPAYLQRSGKSKPT